MIVNHTKVHLTQLWNLLCLPALRRFLCPDVQASELVIHTLETIELWFVPKPEDAATGSAIGVMVYDMWKLNTLQTVTLVCLSIQRPPISPESS